MSGLMGGEITISSLESIAPIQFSFKFDETKDLPMYLGFAEKVIEKYRSLNQ
jgi:hypothetical protein